MSLPFNVGPFELLLVLAIALLILGPGKLPEVGSAMGRTIREFRRASSDIQEETRLTQADDPSTTRVVEPPVRPVEPVEPVRVQPLPDHPATATRPEGS